MINYSRLSFLLSTLLITASGLSMELEPKKTKAKSVEKRLASILSSYPDPKRGLTPLMAAACRGDVEVARILIEKHGVSVDEKDLFGTTALMCAANNNCIRMVNFLIAHCADINAATNNGTTALWLAASNSHDRMVELLIDQYHADLKISKPGLTLLMYIIHEKSSLSTVKLLVEKYKLDVNAQDLHGNSPLHYAVALGNLPLATFLIAAHANVNLFNHKGLTPLHVALEHNKIALAKLLLDAKASVDTTMHFMPLMGTADASLIARLINRGTVKILKGYDNYLQEAHTNSHWHTARLLNLLHKQPQLQQFLYNPQKYVTNYLENHTCPRSALLSRVKSKLTTLVDHHAHHVKQPCSGYTRTDLHQTPFMWAALFNYPRLVQTFLKTAPDWFLNAQDTFGCTALMYAALGDNPAIIKLLLKHPGIKNAINKRSKEQYSALDYAAISGHVTIVRALLENGAQSTSYTVHAASGNNRSRLAAELLIKKLTGADLVNSTENY